MYTYSVIGLRGESVIMDIGHRYPLFVSQPIEDCSQFAKTFDMYMQYMLPYDGRDTLAEGYKLKVNERTKESQSLLILHSSS